MVIRAGMEEPWIPELLWGDVFMVLEYPKLSESKF